MLKRWLALGIVLVPVVTWSTRGQSSMPHVPSASAAAAATMVTSEVVTSDSDWRVGTVSRVDGARGLVLLSDGRALQTTSDTHVLVGRRPAAIGELRPGDIVVFRGPRAPEPAATAPTVPGSMTEPPADSALPREAYSDGAVSVSDVKVVPPTPSR
jgi:hypothetical protein